MRLRDWLGVSVFVSMCALFVYGAWAASYLTTSGTYDNAASGDIRLAAIDGKTVADNTVWTNSSGHDFYVTDISLILTSVSGLGTPPIVSVGVTSAAYTDFVNAFALATVLTAANTSIQPTLVATRVRVPNGTALICRVSTAAIATTTYQFTIVVRGFYL